MKNDTNLDVLLAAESCLLKLAPGVDSDLNVGVQVIISVSASPIGDISPDILASNIPLPLLRVPRTYNVDVPTGTTTVSYTHLTLPTIYSV